MELKEEIELCNTKLHDLSLKYEKLGRELEEINLDNAEESDVKLTNIESELNKLELEKNDLLIKSNELRKLVRMEST